MKWYVWKWWRFAWTGWLDTGGVECRDAEGTWRRKLLGLWWMET